MPRLAVTTAGAQLPEPSAPAPLTACKPCWLLQGASCIGAGCLPARGRCAPAGRRRGRRAGPWPCPEIYSCTILIHVHATTNATSLLKRGGVSGGACSSLHAGHSRGLAADAARPPRPDKTKDSGRRPVSGPLSVARGQQSTSHYAPRNHLVQASLSSRYAGIGARRHLPGPSPLAARRAPRRPLTRPWSRRGGTRTSSP